MTQVLISVRSVDEALLAARHGADLIDLKEPAAGALGALPLSTLREVVHALRDEQIALTVSATIGDLPTTAQRDILDRVAQVAACGVDIVKVGIEPTDGARELLDALARSGHAIVPVFIADRGVDRALVQLALSLGFAGLMLDTADKRAGSLFDALPVAVLRDFVDRTKRSGVKAGLAGALRLDHAEALTALAPDVAGFRTAVCTGGREGTLDPAKLRALRAALQREASIA